MARRYSFLSFAKGVDWQDVNPVLLAKLNQIGIRIGKVITIISGYRTYAEQAALYSRYQHGGNIAAKPGHSFHEKGLAVDALVDGQAIGRVVSAALFKKVGLESLGASLGDWPHVQLPGGKVTKGARGTAPSEGTAGPLSGDQQAPPAIQGEPQIAGGPPDPGTTVAPVLAPGSIQADVNSPQKLADTWQLLSADPLASQETQNLARKLGQSSAA